MSDVSNDARLEGAGVTEGLVFAPNGGHVPAPATDAATDAAYRPADEVAERLLAIQTDRVLREVMDDDYPVLVTDGAKVKKIGALEHEGWTVTRRYSTFQSREVFVSPDGTEYVCTKDPALAEVEIAMKTAGIPPLRLRRRSRPFPNQKAEEE